MRHELIETLEDNGRGKSEGNKVVGLANSSKVAVDDSRNAVSVTRDDALGG